MATKRKNAISIGGKNPISQLLIVATLALVIVAAYQAITQNDFTGIAPTQLFLVAGVLGILGLYIKDEK